MTTAGEIITAAYREGNLLGINATPTTAQQTEGLKRLNVLLAGVFGNEVGVQLVDLTVGGTYSQAEAASQFIPENVRLVMTLSGATTYQLHPNPHDGQRVAISDVGGNLSTYNVTLSGNGRTIEDAASVTLSTDGLNREWFYRADLGNWVRSAELTADDTFPFPLEFDDYFIILLALRLNPRYGQEIQQGSASWLENMANRLEARYRRPRNVQDWGTLGLYGQHDRAYGGSSAAFARGRVW